MGVLSQQQRMERAMKKYLYIILSLVFLLALTWAKIAPSRVTIYQMLPKECFEEKCTPKEMVEFSCPSDNCSYHMKIKDNMYLLYSKDYRATKNQHIWDIQKTKCYGWNLTTLNSDQEKFDLSSHSTNVYCKGDFLRSTNE